MPVTDQPLSDAVCPIADVPDLFYLFRMASQVLILGTDPGVVQRLSAQLRDLGMTPVLQAEKWPGLPSVTDPHAMDRMEELFKKFAESLKENESGYIHPALTFWADRPEVPTLAARHELHVIAPPARVLNSFTNRLSFLQKAEELGIPNLILDPEPMHSLREIERFIDRNAVRFPFVLRSAKGGTRFAQTVIHERGDLTSKLPLWLEQLRRNCGEVMLFAERYQEGKRHIVVPFCRVLDGRVEVFPMVDASLQSRHRKMVEFCPVLGIDATIERKIKKWTVELAGKIGYVGVGHFEFSVDGPRAHLIHGAARLNAGFQLWEQVAGTPVVAWQLAAMRSGKVSLPEFKPSPKWTAGIALRLYAEDPVLQLPQPGHVQELGSKRRWELTNSEAELDLSVEAGQDISIYEHGLIGTLWAGGTDRAQALATVRGALDEIWIAGSLQTNERFLSELLLHPWVREGIFHTGLVDEEFLPALRPSAELAELFPSLVLEIPEVRTSTDTTHRWAVGDQWIKPRAQKILFKTGPDFFDPNGYTGSVQSPDGSTARVCIYPIAPEKWLVRIGQWLMIVRRSVIRSAQKTKTFPKISSLVSGRVHAVLFRQGGHVPPHEPMLIIESQGMLVPHALPVEVRILKWKCVSGQLVRAGEDLAEFEIIAKT
jgi:biotin carboxylase